MLTLALLGIRGRELTRIFLVFITWLGVATCIAAGFVLFDPPHAGGGSESWDGFAFMVLGIIGNLGVFGAGEVVTGVVVAVRELVWLVKPSST